IRYYRPPIESAIVMQGSHPVKLLVVEGARKVVSAAGPWKLSGDWWNPEEWEREEWDLALSDGTVCRVACVAERWFLEGVYDCKCRRLSVCGYLVKSRFESTRRLTVYGTFEPGDVHRIACQVGLQFSRRG